MTFQNNFVFIPKLQLRTDANNDIYRNKMSYNAFLFATGR